MPRALGGVVSRDAAQVLEKYLLPVVIQGNTDPSIEEIGHAFNTHIYTRLVALLESTSFEQGLSLRQFTSGNIAHAVCMAIWGPMFPSHIIPDLAILDENSYSLALSLPFLPSSIYRARQRSQQSLVDFIRKWEAATDAGSATGCSAHGNAVLRALRESSLSGGDQAGLLVAYMFAILSNTMRITFWLLAAGFLAPSTKATKAGGAIGILTAAIAGYTALAGLLTKDTSHFLIPVGNLSRAST